MARLASEAKMGYYPTPPFTISYIAKQLIASSYKVNCLDPCCGEGKALNSIANHLKLNTTLWAIELDEERANIAKNIPNFTVLNGSVFDTRINPLASIGLLYLNPPYSSQNGERTEMQFLKHCIKWLAPQGVLVFIVPEHILENKANRDWIGQYFKNINIYKIYESEYPVFKQIVLFGYKRTKRAEEGEKIPFKPYPFINKLEPNTRLYTIPETENITVFQNNTITDKDIAEQAGLTKEKLYKFFENHDKIDKINPILPLKNGHLVALLSSGVLNGDIQTDNAHLIIKGFSNRISLSMKTDEEEITKNTYNVGIRVIDLKRGEWYDVE